MKDSASNERDKLNKSTSNDVARTRVQTYIKGKLRERFFNDTLKKDISESKLTEMILKIHYCIVEEYPILDGFEYEDLKKMDHNALKQCIIDRIRFR